MISDDERLRVAHNPNGRSGIPTTSKVDLSIVIVNRNTRAMLERCLKSVVSQNGPLSVETVVVDNGSTDGSWEMVEGDFPDALLIRNRSNTGFAFPNNQGIRETRGRYVMLLNSDTVVQAGALRELVAFMEEHPEAGACGPRLRYPDGRLQPSCYSFHSPWRHFCEMVGLSTLFPRSRTFSSLERSFDHSESARVDSLMGAALVVRREVFQTVGLLDERFRIHCNETDLCIRMRNAGWERWFVPTAEVVHELGGTLRSENDDFQMQGEMIGNLFDFYRKHYGSLGLTWFRFWAFFGFGLRSLVHGWSNRLRADTRKARLARMAGMMARTARSGVPEK